MNKKRILLGRATKPHGLKGHVQFSLASGEKTHLQKGHKVWLIPLPASKLPPIGAEFTIEAISKGPQVRVKLVGVEDRTALEELIPCEIYCSREQFPRPKEGEYYVCDLLGLSAVNSAGRELGVVDSFYETPAQLILCVKLRDGSVAELPFVKNFFPAVDLTQGRVEVVLPEYIE